MPPEDTSGSVPVLGVARVGEVGATAEASELAVVRLTVVEACPLVIHFIVSAAPFSYQTESSM